MNPHPPDLISYTEAAALVQRSRRSIERAVGRKYLRGFAVITGSTRRVMVSRSEVLAHFGTRVEQVAS